MYKIGDLVLLTRERQALIRYHGIVEFDNGEEDWYGVELLGLSYGNTDGTVNNVTYFQTKEDCGLFILPTKVIRKLSPGDFEIDMDNDNNDDADDCPDGEEGISSTRRLSRQNSNASNASNMSRRSRRSRGNRTSTLSNISKSRAASEPRHGSTGQLGGMQRQSHEKQKKQSKKQKGFELCNA